MAKTKSIVDRTFEFAVNIVKLANRIGKRSPSAATLSCQVLRSGVSVGANVEEAQAGESRADFIHKYNVALKEARETRYWLKLLAASGIATEEDLDSLTKESDEICRIIGQIVINARKKA